ncbi:MAG TPA: hypothetical protein VHE55_03715 [Fimbriimonadaceae bacterium]|nr:hypothetical protein [Fimbriimonadaceae bacterium]
MPDFEDDPMVKMGVAGALSRELRQDHEMFIQSFARMLQAAFPNEAQLRYEGGFLSKKRLAGVSIQLGDDLYSLVKPSKGPLESTRTHVVRGIALKTEPIPVDQWLAEISAAIEAKVGGDAAARSALAQALGLG